MYIVLGIRLKQVYLCVQVLGHRWESVRLWIDSSNVSLCSDIIIIPRVVESTDYGMDKNQFVGAIQIFSTCSYLPTTRPQPWIFRHSKRDRVSLPMAGHFLNQITLFACCCLLSTHLCKFSQRNAKGPFQGKNFA